MDERVAAARAAAARYADNRYRRFRPRHYKGAFIAALYADMDILQQEMVHNENLLARGRKAWAKNVQTA